MPHQAIYILNSYSPTDTSHYWHVLNLLEQIAARGVRILLIVERANGLPVFRSQSIEVHGLRARKPFWRHLELIWQIRKGVQRGYSSVFIRIALPAALCALTAAIGTRARVLYWQSGTVHDFDRGQPFSLSKLRWWFSTGLPFSIVKRAVDRFVTGPESMIDYYRDRVGVPASRLTLLYNDIDVERFTDTDREATREAERARLGFARDEVVLLFVHRFSPVRRTLFYMPYVIERALAGLSSGGAKCVIAGDGPELPTFKRQVEGTPLAANFRFLGGVPNRDIQKLYCAADIFLHPTYNEGFPRVILEAMASGLPIVSTDAGGTADIMGPAQRRFVVSRDDRDGFADRVRELLQSPAMRTKLGGENVAHVQRFSTPEVAAMYERVLFS